MSHLLFLNFPTYPRRHSPIWSKLISPEDNVLAVPSGNWTINSPFPLMVVATPRKSCPFWVKATSLPITKERCRYSSKSLSLNVRLKFGKNDSKCWRLIHFASLSVHHLGKEKSLSPNVLRKFGFCNEKLIPMPMMTLEICPVSTLLMASDKIPQTFCHLNKDR